MAERAAADRALVAFAVLFAATLPFSIAAAESTLALAAVAWLAAGRPGPRSPLAAPALAYSALTLASALASARPGESLADCKQLLLFALVFILPPALLGGARLRHTFLLAAAASALWGLRHYLAGAGGLEFRERGPYGHYMSWAGVLMLAAVLALAYLLAAPGRRLRLAYFGLLVPLLAALATSYARNAWLGLAIASVVVTLRLRRRWLPILGLALLALLRLAPEAIRERAASSLSIEANQDRLAMVPFGLELVRDNPWLGVGPNQIPRAFAERQELRPQPHLHNNALQIAAERGMLALGAWIWLIATAALQAWRRGRGRALAAAPAAGLGAIAALLTAGSFEYNFGDSEVKMAWLLLLALSLHEAPSEPTREPAQP